MLRWSKSINAEKGQKKEKNLMNRSKVEKAERAETNREGEAKDSKMK